MNLRNRNGLLIVIILGAMIIMRMLDGGFSDARSWLVEEILTLPGIVIGLSFHEFGHAWMSDRLGDPTPRAQGRLTLNPLAHTDWFGFICLIFAGFGWGIPVEIDPRHYKHPRRDEFLVSIAGVVMNLITACVFAFIMRLMIHSGVVLTTMSSSGVTLAQILLDIFRYIVVINISLMVFNLLPVPPLDGFGIVTQIFDLRRYSWYYPLYRSGFWILMLLIMFNIVDIVLNPSVSGILNLISRTIIA